MSNFGRLGSAMVRDAIGASDQYMQTQDWEQGAAGREMQASQDAKTVDASAALTDLYGGPEAEAKARAIDARAAFENRATLRQLKIENQRAKTAKVNAAAAKAAMKGAATAGKTGTTSVPIKTFTRPASR